MRTLPLLMLCLLLGSCSCSRKPDPEATLPTTATLPPSAPAPPPADDAALSRRQAMEAEDRRNLLEAAGTLHTYLAALASGQREAADAMWVGGKPSPVPDDAALRALGPHTMRINTEAPKPLVPDEVPARSLEIPVKLRISDADGTVRVWNGWYRVRRKIGNDGWEISTASMRPQLD